MRKNIIKNFGQFVNENRLRGELVGGKGQKAEYDAMSGEDRDELDMLFTKLSEQDPIATKKFISGLSKYRSLDELKAGLSQLLTHLTNYDDEEYRNMSHDSSSDSGIGQSRQHGPWAGWKKGEGFFYPED